jgi:mono/diheme cytochrome c family protein
MKKNWFSRLSLVLLIASGIYALVIVRNGFSALDEPGTLEAATAKMMRQVATPSDYKDLKNPQAATPENIHEGMEHFADHCAGCHSNNGSGDTFIGKRLYPRAPDMRTETQKMTDGEIYYTIENGIRLTGMPAFGTKGNKTSTSSWNLVLFIRHLPQLTAAEEAEMKKSNPVNPKEMNEDKADEDFLHGKDAKPPETEHHH